MSSQNLMLNASFSFLWSLTSSCYFGTPLLLKQLSGEGMYTITMPLYHQQYITNTLYLSHSHLYKHHTLRLRAPCSVYRQQLPILAAAHTESWLPFPTATVLHDGHFIQFRYYTAVEEVH